MPCIQMEQGLGVGGRAKADAVSFELVAQRGVIVDFTIERDDKPSILARHRLRSTIREIEDRETPMGKSAAPRCVPPNARTVGPARAHRIAGLQELAFIGCARRRVEGENAVYPAPGNSLQKLMTVPCQARG